MSKTSLENQIQSAEYQNPKSSTKERNKINLSREDGPLNHNKIQHFIKQLYH